MSNDMNDVEKANPSELHNDHLKHSYAAGGYLNDRSQASLPAVYRIFASTSPLGLLSFAMGIFLICVYGLHARRLSTPNVLIGVLMFLGGICQFIAGIMEFIIGNTFGATLFPSYAAFNFSYAMIYLPGTGIMAAYTDASTRAVSPEINQTLAIYFWAWFIIAVLFTVAAVKSSLALFIDIFFLDLCLLLLAEGYMIGINVVLTTGNSFGLVVVFLTYWAGCAGLWGDATPIKLPTFELYKQE